MSICAFTWYANPAENRWAASCHDDFLDCSGFGRVHLSNLDMDASLIRTRYLAMQDVPDQALKDPEFRFGLRQTRCDRNVAEGVQNEWWDRLTVVVNGEKKKKRAKFL